MIKKLFFILLLFTTLLFATEQNDRITKKIAENFLYMKNLPYTIDGNFNLYTQKKVVAKVYNISPKGFVVISKDNDLSPVLAYSFKNNLEEKNIDENLFFKMLLADIKLRTKYYKIDNPKTQENHIKWENLLNNYQNNRDFQQWPPINSSPTDGWIETTWNQTGVFNQFCPLDNSNQRSVVGCVATAFSQLLNFHKSIGNITMNNSDRYSCGSNYPYIHIDQDSETRDFPDFPTLNNYLATLKNHYANNIPLTDNDKAALCFMAGITVEMGYSSEGSGAWTEEIIGILRNRMGYTSGQWVDFNGDSTLQIMAEDAKHMRPNEMSIYQSDWSGGHAINCDGYNTDNFFHLNFGWGTSNTTCWYLLPSGMPSGYSVITGVAVNIEGGEIPVEVTGTVNCNISSVGAHILISGEKSAETYVTETNGSFEIPALLPGTYTVTTTLDRIYYNTFETIIDEDNHVLNINLGNFEALTGTINSEESNITANIALYKEGHIVYTGISEADGSYSIPDVLPGDYFATVSLNGNNYVSKNMTVSLNDQTEDFTLNSYDGNLLLSYAKAPTGFFDLSINTPLTVAVKYSSDDLDNINGDIFSKFRFKSPINSNEGTLFAQVWKGDNLFFEKELSDFSEEEWLNITLDNYIEINQNQDYYFGYKIMPNGHIACVDDGPVLENKGAFIRSTGWIEINTLNKNFCIEPIVISQNYGRINGNISINGNNVNYSDITIKAGKFATHPDINGNYSIILKAGNYDVTAFYLDHQSQVVSNVEVIENEDVNNISLVINLTPNNDSNNIQKQTRLYSNYPNPFYLSTSNRSIGTTISYFIENDSDVSLTIYNILGQKIKTLINNEQKKGKHSIIWNGKDIRNKDVASGIYFYRLKNNGKALTKKMLILK